MVASCLTEAKFHFFFFIRGMLLKYDPILGIGAGKVTDQTNEHRDENSDEYSNLCILIIHPSCGFNPDISTGYASKSKMQHPTCIVMLRLEICLYCVRLRLRLRF